MDLNSLIIFKKIADLGGITKAAKGLGLPKSAISQRLSRLEDALGGRLFHRTTRSITLTEFGETVYRHAAVITEQRDMMLDFANSTTETATGLIRMTSPPDLGAYLISSALKRFMIEHPGIRVELDLSTRFVDLASEGFDIAIRATARGLDDSTLIAKKIHETKMALFAAKEYFLSTNSPSSLDNLKDHRMVCFSATPGAKEQTLKLRNKDASSSTITIRPNFTANNYQGAYAAIKAGIGIGLLPEDLARDDISKGILVPVLPDWSSGPAEFYVVYPSRKLLPIRVKLLVQFLEKWGIHG